MDPVATCVEIPGLQDDLVALRLKLPGDPLSPGSIDPRVADNLRAASFGGLTPHQCLGHHRTLPADSVSDLGQLHRSADPLAEFQLVLSGTVR
jgi:hypothetical protein